MPAAHEGFQHSSSVWSLVFSTAGLGRATPHTARSFWTSSTGAAAPGTKATATSDPHSGHTLTSQRAEKYRSLAGRELHHSLDVPLVKFDTGLMMRGMDTPRVLGEVTTPSVRCIAGHPRWTGCFDGRESAKR